MRNVIATLPKWPSTFSDLKISKLLPLIFTIGKKYHCCIVMKVSLKIFSESPTVRGKNIVFLSVFGQKID